ncbi:antibiotic ABC transporter ATP-binding protein [Chitinophaga parva]|uniref:Antibiotic ABC transporter ATP-binding protein n=1 Tax=Chitinophaga parva TaxID=2169414 RepID=A0A2T7BPV9_9BACT|nr:ABC transporter ATP-binding protein [Chitinophaga parva]PUZ29680.1 antibiotic ABC transporter ATP-binding protein [Chitinophaga parva]
MKTYFRLLSFAKPIGKYAIPYIIFTLLAVLFSTLNLALLAPLLTVLFDNSHPVVVQKPEHLFDFMKMLNYYAYVIKTQGDIIQALKFVCGIILISVILGNLFRYLSERTMENLRINTLLNLRRTVFNNVMDLHLGYFSNERKGDIISKIASDVQVVQFSVTGTLQVIFKEPLTLLFYLVTLIVISPQLTLFSILVVPVGGIIIARIVKNLKKQARESHETYGMMISYLDESLNGMRIVKAFNASRYMKKHFDDENRRYSDIMRAMARRQQLASPVSETLGVAMVAGIVLYGGSQVLAGKSGLTAASFITYIAIFSQLMRPAKAISTSFSGIHSGIAAGERVLALIDEKPQIVDAPDAQAIHTFERDIRFDNVSFAYGDNEVLHNVSVTIPKGKTVALVGPSGGGKSTMMDLIPRFIVPSKGRVLIDGHDLENLQTDPVRTLMGVVNQESILFNDTIFNNIAFARPTATMAEVEAAARVANAHNFIMDTEHGYQTNIGDKGSKLSGGQRQRICIARAVLRNPPIMLLDEATSALDTESEKLVQDALNNLMKNRTSLIIAHRLSTIQTADLIIVLEHGRVVEQGTHQELVNQNGLYRKLIDMQTFAAN